MPDNDFTDFGKRKDRSTLKKGALIFIAVALIALVLIEVTRSTPDNIINKPTSQGKSNSANKKALGESTPKSSTNAPTPPPTPTYPIKLPETFSAKQDMVQSGSTVSYYVKDSQGNVYYIVEQPALETLDIGGLEAKLTNVEKLTVPTGTAVIGENRGQLIASIRTAEQNTWILVTAPQLSQRSGVIDLVKSIQPGT